MVMDSLDALVYVSDFESNHLLFLNRHGERIWGKWEGRVCWEVLQARDRGPCEFCTNSLLVDGLGKPTGVHVWEFQNKVNGRWYECRDQAIHWTDGRLVRLEVATDITERRKAEKKVAEQNEFLKNVLESLTHPFCVIDAQSHQLIMANQAAGGDRLDGTLKCHQLSHHSSQPCRSNDHPCPLEIIKRKGKPVTLEHVHFDRQGNRRMVDVHGYPVFDEEGRISQIIEYSIDVTDRKKAEEALKEKEEYLRTIMATIQTGVIIMDGRTRTIVDVNPYALNMIGLKEGIIGQSVDAFINMDEHTLDPEGSKIPIPAGETFRLNTHQKGSLRIRLSQAKTYIRGREYTILSFLDISDLIHLLEEQAVNIQAANQVLRVINTDPLRTIDLPGDRGLYVKGFSIPCNAAGGDHFFVRNLFPETRGGKTILSLKDQSGHEVNCILKSIITDLFHNAIVYNNPQMSLEESLTKLNHHICKSSIFKVEDFLTAVVAEIDHQSLMMRYVSCGHPPFILIRGDDVLSLPALEGPGRNLPIGVLPEAEFTAGAFQLQAGDRLFFYTDGLTEMPWAKNKKKISLDGLKTLIREAEKENPGSPISAIVSQVLAAVSKLSQEKVTPYFINTSSDDVSILAVEVEDQKNFEEAVLGITSPQELSLVIRELKDRIGAQWKYRGLENPKNRIDPVLEEAVTNAWRHGNRENPSKKVTVRWRFGNDFHLEVLDQGEGFNQENIPDPTKKENRFLETGRGIFMMRFLADDLRWEEGGRKTVVSFRTQGIPREREDVLKRDELMPLWRHN
jgi:PAS domain S-box-containing protein